jgi:predicted  nucleic acid-binding Zn-ribbon protein
MDQFPDSSIMSIRSNTGIQIPNDSLERANKSTLVSIIEQLTNKLSSVESELADVREDSDRLSRKVADTRGDVSDIREDTDRVSKKIADTNSRVSDLEDNTDASETSGSDNDVSNSNGEHTQSTALEQVCALSEEESQEHLTANQKRARKIARRINELGKSVPAGIAITSTRMRDILSGMEEKRVHRQTIQRVMDFLERFGDEHVNKKETKGGKTVVVFSESVVKDVVTASENTTVTPTIL